jgi:hypothetical protein
MAIFQNATNFGLEHKNASKNGGNILSLIIEVQNKRKFPYLQPPSLLSLTHALDHSLFLSLPFSHPADTRICRLLVISMKKLRRGCTRS